MSDRLEPTAVNQLMEFIHAWKRCETPLNYREVVQKKLDLESLFWKLVAKGLVAYSDRTKNYYLPMYHNGICTQCLRTADEAYHQDCYPTIRFLLDLSYNFPEAYMVLKEYLGDLKEDWSQKLIDELRVDYEP